MKKTSLLGIVVMSLLNASCAHSFDRTVSYLDRDRFMGTWYVQAGRFTWFEKGAFNATETYTWNEKKQQIDIDFRFNKDSLTGSEKRIPQTGWIKDQTTHATWKISPFWPLRFTYLVIALDVNYEWTAIGVPNQNYLWIMSRDTNFSRARIDDVLKQVSELGYSTSDVVYVEHSKK